MAHQSQLEFVDLQRQKIKEIQNKDVIEFGSLNINGSVRYLFNGCKSYTGVDCGEGSGVDVVSLCHEFQSDKKYDIVISCEMLEHDMFWDKSLRKMYDVLKSKGIFIFTCATTGRPEHGTRRTTPEDSPLTLDWDYYYNITINDFYRAYDNKITDMFVLFYFYVVGTDLYFWGIKR